MKKSLLCLTALFMFALSSAFAGEAKECKKCAGDKDAQCTCCKDAKKDKAACPSDKDAKQCPSKDAKPAPAPEKK